MYMCDKCAKTSALLLLLVGIAFLLVDLGVWTFWNLKWWTVVFLLMGLGKFCMAGCPMCKELREGKKKK